MYIKTSFYSKSVCKISYIPNSNNLRSVWKKINKMEKRYVLIYKTHLCSLYLVSFSFNPVQCFPLKKQLVHGRKNILWTFSSVSPVFTQMYKNKLKVSPQSDPLLWNKLSFTPLLPPPSVSVHSAFGSQARTFQNNYFGPKFPDIRCWETQKPRSQNRLSPQFLPPSCLCLLGRCLSSPAEPNSRVFTSLL